MLSFLRFISLPTFVFLAVLGWLWLDSELGWHGPRVQWLGIVLVASGAFLAAWCFRVFLSIGHGTPHPFVAKTKHLVKTGPYSVVRNPMMWGVGAILIGIALWVGSVGLWFGCVMFVVFVAFFVRLYEEPDMNKRFGEEYRAYCCQVPRWWPRLHRKLV